jgi:protein ImuB
MFRTSWSLLRTFMAFASIFVPNFMLQAVVRAEPALREQIVALIDGNPPLCHVVAVNERAVRAGLEIGMTKLNASQFAGVEMRPRSSAQETIAHGVLLDIGWSVSPRLEDTARDTIVLDLSGLEQLFGAEREIGAHLARRASECGLLAHVAIATNVDTALIAARGFAGVTVIPPGEEAKRLGVLPAGVLSLSEETAETLGRWGVRTCADFAALPILQLSERLGQEGVRLHALASGAVARSLAIAEPSHFFQEEMELDDGVEDLDPLSFLLGRLLDQLCARLAARSLAAASIRIRFELQPDFENALDRRKEIVRQIDPPAAFERELQLPVPSRDSKMLLKLLRLRLQSSAPGAPVRKITLGAESARPRATQGGLFLPSFPDPEKLEVTIARIANVVGQGNVGSPSLVDTWRPGEFQMQRFLAPVEIAETGGDAREPSVAFKTPASFRMFRPSLPASLELHADRPTRIFFQGQRGDVLSAAGPWRTSGDWWREDGWQQDEWDLEIRFHPPLHPLRMAPTAVGTAEVRSDGGLYRVYYDAVRVGWFVRGVYD